jgi:hypothetical protein
MTNPSIVDKEKVDEYIDLIVDSQITFSLSEV